MSDTTSALVEELARRAGLDRLPRPVLIAILSLAVALCGWATWRWWPRSEPVPTVIEEADSTPMAPDALAAEATDTATVTVHVTGAVRRSGVYELPTGTRVSHAVEAAGGLLPDAVPERVNLARILTDGEQVHIPDEDEPLEAPVASQPMPPGGTPGTASTVNVNTADATLLDTLPGVGPSTAEKIVADREANGPFRSIDDLGRVSGIGPKKLEQLHGFVSVQ